MKIIQFTEPGPPEVLRCLDVPIPVPREGEVLVRAHSIGVGVPDTLIRAGRYGWMPPLPATPGTEMSGTIEQVGPGVTTRHPGQLVLVSARERKHRGGCYTEYITTAADTAFVLPPGIDLEGAAALANYQVAYHMPHDAMRPMPGQSILLHAAAGGMGNAVIDLAALMGVTVIGVAGGAAKAEFARSLGAARVIDRQTEDAATAVADATSGRGVDFVIDPVGGPDVLRHLDLIAPMGMLVIYGSLGGRAQGDALTAMREHGATCPAVRCFSIHAYDGRIEERRRGMRQLIEWLAAGKPHPRIFARLKLDEARKAHELLEGGQVLGKLLPQP